jgi:hypothetical protein
MSSKSIPLKRKATRKEVTSSSSDEDTGMFYLIEYTNDKYARYDIVQDKQIILNKEQPQSDQA